ncbi:hypothetical protein HHI36_006417, partial [Cryptolaemus montrouzieri]
VFLEEQDADIVALSEHWKSLEQLLTYQLNGYKLISSFCRDLKKHGGCALLWRNNLVCTIRKDFEALSVAEFFESAAIQVSLIHYILIVLCIYRLYTRPEADVNFSFEHIAATILDKCLAENDRVNIAVDFNIDIVNSREKRNFQGLLDSYGVKVTTNGQLE